jgi:hypothetical protein
MSQFSRKERETLLISSLLGVFKNEMNLKNQETILVNNLFMASIIPFNLLFPHPVADHSSLN